MTNPNNAIGTNAAYDGRTSVEAFNDVMGAFSRGLVSGWGCTPNTGLTVSLGGNGTDRDVAIAEDSAGNRTSINNRSGSPVDVTISAAPASNTRIDAIVAYVESSPTGSSTTTDNPAPCGIIAVAGTPSGSPVAPNDSAIRTAITADGASGTTAFYVILAYITIPSGTTDLTSANIAAGPYVKINAPNIIPDGGINNANLGPDAVETTNIKNGAVTSSKIDFTTMDWDNGTTIGDYNNTPVKIKVISGTMPSSVNTWKTIGNIGANPTVFGALGSFIDGGTNYPFPGTNSSETNAIYVDSTGSVNVKSDYNYALNKSCKVMVFYI